MKRVGHNPIKKVHEIKICKFDFMHFYFLEISMYNSFFLMRAPASLFTSVKVTGSVELPIVFGANVR